MSKALPAECSNGIVTVGGLPIPNTTILSKGIGSTNGLAVLDEETKTYIPDTTPDLETTLTNLSSSLDTLNTTIQKIANMFTAVAAAMTGPTTAPPPTLPADVVLLTTYAAQISATKTQVDQLKETLG